MSSFKNRVPINGSKRTIMVGAKRTEAVSLQEKMRVGLYLRCRKYSAGEPSLEKLMNNDSLDKTYLTHDEFELKHGAFPEDVIKVKEFLREHGLTIESINLSHRLIIFFHKANNMSFLSADHCGRCDVLFCVPIKDSSLHSTKNNSAQKLLTDSK